MGGNPSSIGDAYGLAARSVAKATGRQRLWVIGAAVAVLALPFVAVVISTLF